ncbi:MAG: sensor histidine kinase [Actinomycetota bacterium]
MRARSLLGRLLLAHIVVAAVTFGLLAVAANGIFEHPARLALILLGIVLLSAGSSVVVARSVARPLGRIAEEVTQVAQGGVADVDPAGPREARELAVAVNVMAEQLSRRVQDLRLETGLREEILGAMEDAVLLVNHREVVYANRAAATLLGAEADSPLPPHLSRHMVDEGGVSEFAVHHPVYRDLRATSTVLPDGRLLVVTQDVTDARRIDRIRRDFVANASHEMKTPVAGILATAETLQDAIRDDPVAAERFAANLAKEATRLSNMVQDLLDLARLDQGEPAENMLVSLSAVLKEVLHDAENAATAKRIKITAMIADGIQIIGQAHDLALLGRNLLDNAIRYTADGGSIRVELSEDDGRAILVVSDTGLGIPAKDLPRIFERFYRVDKARARETGGTGLGLSIVRHVAESHGGSVGAESTLGVGSTFTVSLPCREAKRLGAS